ncbi:MAG: murein L,D-transpeptidase family protein [Mangrovibacterium sp.]
MRRRKRKQIVLAVVVGVIILLIAGGLLILLAPEPPQNELKLAREALAAAKKAGADMYATSVYQEAQQLYDSAMVCWSVQNSRFFPLRDFEKMTDFVQQVTKKANEAREQAIQQSSNTSKLVRQGIAELNAKVSLYERRYKHMPLPSGVISDHNVGKMKLSEARIALESSRYKEAYQRYLQAVELVNRSNDRAERILTDWFDQYPLWKKHAEQAILLSKGGQKVILVDKYAHSCMVYQSGKMIRQFNAEFGINWMGHKRRKGDKATPEGIYRITQKKDGGRTKFGKALLINYPNDEDRKRFAEDKRKGLIPSRADIGGLIEIHGTGGKGVDWTEGCVALKNSDMDALFRLVAPGTPVIIVGSLNPLN